MLARLIKKELLHHLVDYRFLTAFAFCALLSVLSTYAGVKNYGRRLQEYNTVSESNRRAFQERVLNEGELNRLYFDGYRWNQPPQVLSPIVFGLSGNLGQEVAIRYGYPPLFEASAFETDPIVALFSVIDLAAIVKLVLSLCVLLFTYDAICGEKESGTLRLFASFPVSRHALVLAKLLGSTLTILIPFLIALLLAAVVLVLSPEIYLTPEHWIRIGLLTGVFLLYLTVFASFGLLVSALTHRRMIAFLLLLSLWTLWIFVVPALSIDIAQRMVPSTRFYALQKQALELSWKAKADAMAEKKAYFEKNALGLEDWTSLTFNLRGERLDALFQTEQQHRDFWNTLYKIDSGHNAKYHTQMNSLRHRKKNQVRSQRHLAMILSAISPFSAVSYLSTDLAQTGFSHHERIEGALNNYFIYLDQYVQEKMRQKFGFLYGHTDLTDFTVFTFASTETVGECLAQNLVHIINLALLALLGFTGAYVAILRYDVR